MSDTFLPYIYADNLWASCIALPLVGTCLTGVRFYVRAAAEQRRGIDDWFALLAIFFVWATAAVVLHGVNKRAVGYPTLSADPDYPSIRLLMSKLQYAFWIPLTLAFGAIKMSVILFYRRVFVVRPGLLNAALWIAATIAALWTVLFTFLNIFSCGTVPSNYWTPGMDGACINGQQLYLAFAASDLATDVSIFLLPLSTLWKLHMGLKRKLSVTFILLLGALSLIASAFRLAVHIGIDMHPRSKTADALLTNTLLFYWSILEAGIAVVAINLPTLGQLFSLRSVKSVVHSVRSVLSLESLKGHASQPFARKSASSDAISSSNEKAGFGMTVSVEANQNGLRGTSFQV